MIKKELIRLASIACGKNMDYETFKYSDYLYGEESEVENVWKYVEEYRENGEKAFYEKYKYYKLY
jgi:hypothetical protein